MVKTKPYRYRQIPEQNMLFGLDTAYEHYRQKNKLNSRALQRKCPTKITKINNIKNKNI